MLDVHPPHHAAHTWRDFFIHIATIVVGLCIAVGLEQTVEHIHEHNQVKEARAMLREEREANRHALDRDAGNVDNHLVQLWEDLAVIARVRAHESQPHDQILFVRPHTVFNSAAWQTVHASNVSAHMDPRKLQTYGYLYSQQQIINDMSTTVGNQLQDSLSPLVTSEDRRLETTAEIKEIELSSAKDRTSANRLMSHHNHPERLSAAQFDTIEQALCQGIIADRRLQRYLAALDNNYADFDKAHPAR
jgi:hypothetical protein